MNPNFTEKNTSGGTTARRFTGVTMKKIIGILLVALTAVAASFAVPTASNETKPENWSNMTYVNLPIYKILDSTDGYVVVYAKNRIGAGSTVVPKSWNKGNPDKPRKLKIRKLYGGTLKSFMTIVKKNGEFHHVVLTVPTNRSDSVWGIMEGGQKVDGSDKETLEELEI